MTSRGHYILPGAGPLLPEMPLPPMPPPEFDPPRTTYVIEYDSRSDGGPRRVGPFDDRATAQRHADSHNGPGFTASWCVVPVTSPEADT